jgi:hypothetical protein
VYFSIIFFLPPRISYKFVHCQFLNSRSPLLKYEHASVPRNVIPSPPLTALMWTMAHCGMETLGFHEQSRVRGNSLSKFCPQSMLGVLPILIWQWWWPFSKVYVLEFPHLQWYVNTKVDKEEEATTEHCENSSVELRGLLFNCVLPLTFENIGCGFLVVV